MRRVLGLLALLRGDPEADRAVPPSGATGHLTIAGAAAMAFLLAFALCGALAAGRVASTWDVTLNRSATLEVPSTGPEAEARAAHALDLLASTPGIESARRLDATEIARLLAPWTGEEAALDELPFPVLIAVEEGEDLDRESLDLRLAGELPFARYSRHDAIATPVRAAAGRLNALGLFAAALATLTMGIVIVLAARASLAMNAGVIATLRGLGATDAYIARAFVRRFTLRGAAGAGIGTALALLALLLIPGWGAEAPGGLRPASAWGWLLLLAIPPLGAAMAFLATRRAALRTLRRLT